MDSRIQALLKRETVLRRDPAGIGIGLFVTTTAIGGGLLALAQGGWWLLALILLVIWGVVGAVGLAVSWPKRNRDEKGNLIAEVDDSNP